MHSTKLLALIPILLLFSFLVTAQDEFLYKQIDTAHLYVEVYYPKVSKEDGQNPAMIFFFGGGWKGGNRDQFLPHAEYFSSRGIVCFLADYRTAEKHGVTPFECVQDAKSAIRFIRHNAEKFGVDPNQIIASGGSAGGHLAAATATLEKFNDPGDDLSISCIPNALVLFNPVIDNGPGGYGFERIGEAFVDFSPLHNVRAGMPPTIIFLGTNDRLIPVQTMAYFKTVIRKIGTQCELNLYKNQEHGFFNYRNLKYYKKTVRAADDFLFRLGYLRNEPTVEIK